MVLVTATHVSLPSNSVKGANQLRADRRRFPTGSIRFAVQSFDVMENGAAGSRGVQASREG
jgi:hypothetical protein